MSALEATSFRTADHTLAAEVRCIDCKGPLFPVRQDAGAEIVACGSGRCRVLSHEQGPDGSCFVRAWGGSEKWPACRRAVA